MSEFERLTKRKDHDCACWNGQQDHNTHRRYIELLNRLAAYEDIGSPSDFASAKARIAELEAQLAASRRREEAAKNDIAHNCLHCENLRADGGCKCIPDGDAYSPDYTEGFNRDDCDNWEWRVAETEKEDAE